jgi:tetratricopeptide (TPR) repeat protein
MALECLAYQAIQQGDHQQACRLVEEALEMSRGMGDKWSMAILLSDLALFRVLLGRYDEAAQLCAEGLALSRQLADRLLTAFFLSILAGAQAGQGRHRSAARLWGAMHALLESVASPLQQSHKMWIGDRYISAAEGSLGKAAFDEALEEGRTMSWTLALQYAAAEISSTQGPQGTLLLRAASGAS